MVCQSDTLTFRAHAQRGLVLCVCLCDALILGYCKLINFVEMKVPIQPGANLNKKGFSYIASFKSYGVI